MLQRLQLHTQSLLVLLVLEHPLVNKLMRQTVAILFLELEL
jgi:hypothetical protein